MCKVESGAVSAWEPLESGNPLDARTGRQRRLRSHAYVACDGGVCHPVLPVVVLVSQPSATTTSRDSLDASLLSFSPVLAN